MPSGWALWRHCLHRNSCRNSFFGVSAGRESGSKLCATWSVVSSNWLRISSSQHSLRLTPSPPPYLPLHSIGLICTSCEVWWGSGTSVENDYVVREDRKAQQRMKGQRIKDRRIGSHTGRQKKEMLAHSWLGQKISKEKCQHLIKLSRNAVRMRNPEVTVIINVCVLWAGGSCLLVLMAFVMMQFCAAFSPFCCRATAEHVMVSLLREVLQNPEPKHACQPPTT